MIQQPGIVQVAQIPLRAGPSDRDEMVSQLLFGELVDILDVRKNWTKVRCEWDDYEGWCDTKQIQNITEDTFFRYQANHALNLDPLHPAVGDDYFIQLPMGATLPDFDGLRFQINGQYFRFSGQAVTVSQLAPTPELLNKFARRYLHAPYLWGGRSPLGIDCSGLTQMVYKLANIRLLRDASQQVNQGRLIDFMHEVQAGDLAFFENEKGKISHVGILAGPDSIIHAYGWVRLDPIDHFGIYNIGLKKYTHRLRVVHRFINDFAGTPIAAPENTKQIALSF